MQKLKEKKKREKKETGNGDTRIRQGHFGWAGEARVDPGLHKQEWRMSLPPSFL